MCGLSRLLSRGNTSLITGLNPNPMPTIATTTAMAFDQVNSIKKKHPFFKRRDGQTPTNYSKTTTPSSLALAVPSHLRLHHRRQRHLARC